MKAALLHPQIPQDAPKDEQDVLIQVKAVGNALEHLGFEPVPVSFSMDLAHVQQNLQDIDPAFVFNLVESVSGQGRLLYLAPALLDSMRLSYTGSPTEALFLSSNKVLAKSFLDFAQIPTPKSFTPDSLTGALRQLHGRYIIKSVWEHASVGLDEDSVVDIHQPEDLLRQMNLRINKLGGECFAEEFIQGREFNLSLLEDGHGGVQVLPAAEICFENFAPGKPRIVDYDAKWNEESRAYRDTPRTFNIPESDLSLVRRLKIIALDCWRLFKLKGYARVDFRVDSQGLPWVLEINANPCISPDSGFIAAGSQAGLDFDTVIKRIMENRVKHKPCNTETTL